MKISLGRGLRAIAFAFFASSLALGAASAGPPDRVTGVRAFIDNQSKHYAWVDISLSHVMRADWTIEKAFCVAPNARESAVVSERGPIPGQQARVRAYIMSGDGCKTSTKYVLTTRQGLDHAKIKQIDYTIREHFIEVK